MSINKPKKKYHVNELEMYSELIIFHLSNETSDNFLMLLFRSQIKLTKFVKLVLPNENITIIPLCDLREIDLGKFEESRQFLEKEIKTYSRQKKEE